jgi:hypothetical protein
MTTFDRITVLVIRITGVFQVLLGIAFWTRNALPLIPIHMLVGSLFVISLLVLGIRACVKGAGAGRAALLMGWGVFVLAFGMVQAQILPGPYHWVIRTLHLLVGIVAMALADRTSRGLKSSKPGRPTVLDARPA